MSLINEIKQFEKQVAEARKDYLHNLGSSTLISGLSFINDMSPGVLSKNELLLGHTILHSQYTQRKPKIEPQSIIKIHKIFIIEMKKRSMEHIPFDKLDYL